MPDVSLQVFTDPDAYHAAIPHAHAEGMIIGRGPFRAESTRVRLDRLWLNRGAESSPRVAYAAPDPKKFLIVFATRPGTQVHLNGLELSQDDIIALGSEGNRRSYTPCQWGSVALMRDDLAAAGEALMGGELVAPPVTRLIKPPPAALRRLLNLHEAAGHLAKTAPDILAQLAVGRAMDQALVEATVACLASGDAVEQRHVYRHHARVMRRLEEFLQTNLEGPLYMDDLCSATGVSYRTLYVCCQEHLGMSPKRYLLLRRMHLAWRALQKGDVGRTTVTEIATNYGFWELGRFSVVYRSLFGESPSTTLRRPPDDPRPLEIAGANVKLAESA
ncbi:MAG: helix-turn-helix transcriptional regulator [Alphaproteobacteria bacterium]|nr:helix-turn-helix transcriptional regulator [Alphaproteobacteria bacterium]